LSTALHVVRAAAQGYVRLCVLCLSAFLGYGREHERDAFEHGGMTLVWGLASLVVLAPLWIAGAALVGLVT
jgi:hypothetical protein